MATTVWKGHIAFGLVSFPVKLYSAARSENISFNQLHKTDNSRVKQVLYCQVEDKPIPRTEIVKGFEYEKDHWVVVEDEEIKSMAPPTAKIMEILEFVKAVDVDPLYYENSYYIAPDAAGEKPYALLYEALRRSGFVGVAKVAMHNREHIVIFRPGPTGLVMHTMYYAHEVRKVEEFRTDTTLATDKEMQLATMLIDSLAAPFEPEKYKDSYRDNIQALIDAKVAGREVVAPPEPVTAKVIDIMEALRQSLAATTKKPAATATMAVSAGEPQEEAQRAAVRKPRKKAAG